MNGFKRRLAAGFVPAGLLVIMMVASGGCKKKSEPAQPVETKKVAAIAIEQTMCPVIEGAINKDIFTEYKGKKVYFCCAGCKQEFEKQPEKYLGKLPQFKE